MVYNDIMDEYETLKEKIYNLPEVSEVMKMVRNGKRDREKYDEMTKKVVNELFGVEKFDLSDFDVGDTSVETMGEIEQKLYLYCSLMGDICFKGDSYGDIIDDLIDMDQVVYNSSTTVFFEFPGWDYHDDCEGWDGGSTRCECDNTKVYWSRLMLVDDDEKTIWAKWYPMV